jgi:hypothetical protein
MAKKNPFSKGGFEKSRFDKEPKGAKEGSKKDMAADKKQRQQYKKAGGRGK